MSEPFRPTLCIDTHELAWAAGFFDGEGSVCLRRQGGWMELYLQVPQSGDTATLERFRRAMLGLGRIGGPWKYKGGTLPAYTLFLRGYTQVQTAIALLWKFLSEPKRAQAEAAMLTCKQYFQARALHGKGKAKLTLVEAADLRAAYAAAKAGRQRAPKGFMARMAEHYCVSPYTIQHICCGAGYA